MLEPSEARSAVCTFLLCYPLQLLALPEPKEGFSGDAHRVPSTGPSRCGADGTPGALSPLCQPWESPEVSFPPGQALICQERTPGSRVTPTPLSIISSEGQPPRPPSQCRVNSPQTAKHRPSGALLLLRGRIRPCRPEPSAGGRRGRSPTHRSGGRRAASGGPSHCQHPGPRGSNSTRLHCPLLPWGGGGPRILCTFKTAEQCRLCRQRKSTPHSYIPALVLKVSDSPMPPTPQPKPRHFLSRDPNTREYSFQSLFELPVKLA